MKLKTAQGLILGLLFTGGLINYLDRAVFGLLAPQISADLKLDAAQMGLAFSVFSLGYAGFCVFGGWAADRFGARRTVTVSMVMWSLFCAATGAVTSLLSLLVVRALFGVGESPWTPAANKTLSQWFSKDRYSSAFGVSNAGQPLGGVIAGPLIAGLGILVDWRWSFVMVALLGLIWTACWVWLSSDSPAANRWVDANERTAFADMKAQADGKGPKTEPVWRSISRPTVLAMTACIFAAMYLMFFFISWFPSYLAQAHKMKLSELGMASSVPWVLGVLGMLLGGFTCDAAARWLGNRVLALKLVLTINFALAAACVMLVGGATTATAAVTLMSIAIGFNYIAGPTYFSLALLAVPAGNVGSVTGFMLVVGVLGGMVSPLVTGYIVRDTGSFSSAFYTAGVVVFVAVGLVVMFVRQPQAPRAIGKAAAAS